jgi:hypothetical protein
MKKILLNPAIAILFASCVPLINTPVPYKSSPSIKKVGLFPVMIGKMYRPLFPLIDAAAFNGKTNEIADQILDMQDRTIDKMRENAAVTLQKYLNCEVIYGDALHNDSAFTALSARYNFKSALILNDDNFPKITISSGDINPFNYSNGDVIAYFGTPSNYKETVKYICKELNLDALAVSFSKLSVINVTAFGISGNLRLETYLYVFDKNGDFIANGRGFSKPMGINGKELFYYQMQLEYFPTLLEQVASKLVSAPVK